MELRQLLLTVLLWLQFIAPFAQVIENPVFDRTDQSSLHIDKVEITPDTTFVYCSFYAEANSWANISGDTYIISYPSKKGFKLLSSTGLPIAPTERNFALEERCEVLFCFPSIKGSDQFDFIENPYDNAFNIYGISMSQRSDVVQNNTLEHAKTLKNKADFYASIHNYEKAIEYEKQALPIIKYWFGKLDVPYESSVFMLGHYYSMLHMYEESNKYLEESLNISLILHGEEDLLYTTKLTYIANNCIGIGNVIEGIRLYEKSLSIERQISQGDDSKYVRTLLLLAQAYQMIDDVTKALQYTEEAYSIFEKVKNDYLDEYLSTSISLAGLFFSTMDIEKAKEIASKAFSTIKENYGKENDLYLTCLSVLSNCALMSNETNEAFLYAQEMKEVSEKIYGDQSLQYGSSLGLISEIYGIGFHDYNQAINYDLKSLDVMKSSMSDIDYANRLGHLAKDYAKINDFNEALHYSRVSIDLIKKQSRDFEKITIDQRYSLWSKYYRNVMLRYPLYVSNCRDANEVGILYDNYLFFKGITSKTNNNSFNWKDVQGSLKEGEMAIEFVESIEQDTINCYYAMIIRKEYDNPKLIRLFNLVQFGELFQGSMSLQEKNTTLGENIWGALRNELIDIKNIYFSPTGILHSIWVENLPYDETNCYSDLYNMYRLSSTRELCIENSHTQLKNAVLFGGLDYSRILTSSNNETSDRSGFDYLYNTYDEVNSVAKTLKENGVECVLLSGKEGTEKKFKSLSGQDLSILHMATHGMNIKKDSVEKMKNNNNLIFMNKNSIDYFDYPSDVLTWSFLVLSGGNLLIHRNQMLGSEDDGILTALEVAKLDFHNIDLVVLSACESGLGYNGTDDILMGIHRGFKDAGANTIIMSLNKVDDEATKLLMVEFYKNLMKGKTKHQSLKDAQKYLRKIQNGKYDKPEYWASFIMLDGLN